MVQYKARYGKVWKSRIDGKMYGDSIEVKTGDDIKNYTQVPDPKKGGGQKPSYGKEPTKTMFNLNKEGDE